MIGRAQIERMKKGACLINTARDTLVDEDAVYDALRSGHLGGGAFDVVRIPDLSIPPELGRRHRLFDAPNVVIATHIGGATLRDDGPRRRDGRRRDRPAGVRPAVRKPGQPGRAWEGGEPCLMRT